MFLLCDAVIGLLNLYKISSSGMDIGKYIAGFIVFLSIVFVRRLFRTNIMDLLCIMPILSFVLIFVINKKGADLNTGIFICCYLHFDTLRSYIYDRVRQPKLSLGRLKIRCNSLFHTTELNIPDCIDPKQLIPERMYMSQRN